MCNCVCSYSLRMLVYMETRRQDSHVLWGLVQVGGGGQSRYLRIVHVGGGGQSRYLRIVHVGG